MSIEKKKLKIIDWVIDQKDSEYLQNVQNLIDGINYDEDSRTKVIGLRPNGSEVIKSQFVSCILMSENNIKNGEYMTFEELEKESENW